VTAAKGSANPLALRLLRRSKRKKRHSLEGHRWNIRSSVAQPIEDPANSPLQALIERYLEQVETLKKPNTFRKYECVLQRFGEHFRGRTLSDITVEQLNDFVVKLKKGGMSANTVLHNVIIIAQFSKRNGRPGITKQLQLPEQILPLPQGVNGARVGKISRCMRSL
jgi:hypothetical protein